MLILVGVTVTIVMNGGLFEQARTAKTKTKTEVDKESLINYRLGEYYDPKTGVLNLRSLSTDSEFLKEWNVISSLENNETEMTIENKESKNQYVLKSEGEIEEKSGEIEEEGEKTLAENLKSGDNVTVILKEPADDRDVTLNYGENIESIMIGDKCLALINERMDFTDSPYIQYTTGRFDNDTPLDIYVYFKGGTTAFGTTITDSGWYSYDGIGLSKATEIPSYTGNVDDISLTSYGLFDQVFDFYVQ